MSAAPTEERDEEPSWWSTWPEDEWRYYSDSTHGIPPVRDPDRYNNYARYEPDDELRAVRSNADLAAWFEHKRATTPAVSREERLAQIAASEPYSEQDFFRNPETGEVEILHSLPDGVGPIVKDGPRIMPRPKHMRPRAPGERGFFFDVNDGGIKERLPDGSVLFISPGAPQEFN